MVGRTADASPVSPAVARPLRGTEVNVHSGDVVLDGSQLPLKGAEPPSNFRFMSITAKQLDG